MGIIDYSIRRRAGKVPSPIWLPLITPGVHNLKLRYTNNTTQGFRNRRLVIHQIKGS